MVLCIIGDCGKKVDGIKSEFFLYLQLSRTKVKRLKSFAIDCGFEGKEHFKDQARLQSPLRFGKPVASWDRFNVDWVPTLNVTKKKHSKKSVEAAADQNERAKTRRKNVMERQESKAAKKRELLNQSGERLVNVDFTDSPSTSTAEMENSKAMMLDEPIASSEGAGEGGETDTASLPTTMDNETQTEPCVSSEGASNVE